VIVASGESRVLPSREGNGVEVKILNLYSRNVTLFKLLLFITINFLTSDIRWLKLSQGHNLNNMKRSRSRSLRRALLKYIFTANFLKIKYGLLKKSFY